MKEIEISDKQLIKARQMSVDMGTLNNSITKGQGNIVGFLGELIVADHFDAEQDNTFEHDLLLHGYDGENYTIDVKSKKCTSAPKPYYECSIAAYNTKQDCDIYVFTRILSNLHKGWILGWMWKEEYFDRATFLKKGQVDPSNNFKVKADCYNIKIEDLYKV